MKKLAIAFAVLIVAAVAAVLVVPGMIDWNQHRDRIARQVKAATGRDLIIGGDVRMTVLPAPALSVKDVRLANLAGASVRDMVRLDTLEVRIALGPLLGGNVQVESVRLVKPVIELEALADGRRNWSFGGDAGAAGASAPAGPPPAPASPAQNDGGLASSVRLDNFVIEGGTLVYRDARAGTVERIDGIDATVAAASLNGPFDSKGRLVARGIPLRYDVNIGRIIHERTVPVTLTLGAGQDAAKVVLNGTVIGLADKPGLKGRIKGDGASLASLLRAVAGADQPGLFGQPFSFEAAVQADAEGAELKGLTATLGETQAQGELAARFGDVVAVQARINVNRIDLDKWLALPAVAPVTPAEKDAPVRQRPLATAQPAGASAAAGGFAFPANVSASLAATIDALTYRGGVIRQALVNAELGNGELTVSQLSAQLPGGSDMAVFGFVTTPEGKPRFDGEMELAVSDLRGVMKWLGVTPLDVPADRLRRLNVAGKVTANPEQVQVSGLDLKIDNSRLTGGVAVALRDRPSFGADLVLDQINLDGYLPAPARSTGKAPGGAPAAGPAGTAPSADGAAPAANPLAALAALGTFDANLRAHVKNLTVRQTTMRDVVLDGTLFNGQLDLRRLSVGKGAGATLNLSGRLAKLTGVPEAAGLAAEVVIDDLPRLMRLVGTPPDGPMPKLGEIAIKTRLDGSLLKPTVDLDARVAGATVGIRGSASLLPLPGFDADVRIRHGNVLGLLATFDVPYRPAGRLGALDVAAKVTGDPAALTLTGIKAALGTLAVEGAARLALGGAKPRIGAELTTGEIVVDHFLPAQRTSLLPFDPARLFGHPGLVPAAERTPAAPARRRAPGAGGGRWPTNPIDLAALGLVDADVTLRSTAITFDKYRLENADVKARVADGVLTAERVKGTLFGGAMEGTAVVRSQPRAALETKISLKDVDVARTLTAVSGSASATGSVGLTADLATQGASVADMVSALAGKGRIELKGVDASGAAHGTALAPVLNLLVSLNQLGGGRGGAKADVSGSFLVDKGIARSTDLRLTSGVGEGAATATVDLPAWQIDAAGEMNLSQNLVAQLLARRTNAPTVLPFTVKGSLDAPNVKLDTAGLPGGALPIPGVDRLLQKKGVGDVLRQILPGQGGGEAAPQATPPSQGGTTDGTLPPPPPPPSQQQQQQQQQKPKPADILRGILGR